MWMASSKTTLKNNLSGLQEFLIGIRTLYHQVAVLVDYHIPNILPVNL